MDKGPHLGFFYFASCPFCQIVMDVIDHHNIKLEMLDIISNKEALERLVKDTGRRSVPCLYIDNKPMHESRDIMAWLEKNVDSLEKS